MATRRLARTPPRLAGAAFLRRGLEHRVPKGNELLVQTVADGALFTKLIDKADLDPALARTFDKLDVYETR